MGQVFHLATAQLGALLNLLVLPVLLLLTFHLRNILVCHQVIRRFLLLTNLGLQAHLKVPNTAPVTMQPVQLTHQRHLGIHPPVPDTAPLHPRTRLLLQATVLLLPLIHQPVLRILRQVPVTVPLRPAIHQLLQATVQHRPVIAPLHLVTALLHPATHPQVLVIRLRLHRIRQQVHLTRLLHPVTVPLHPHILLQAHHILLPVPVTALLPRRIHQLAPRILQRAQATRLRLLATVPHHQAIPLPVQSTLLPALLTAQHRQSTAHPVQSMPRHLHPILHLRHLTAHRLQVTLHQAQNIPHPVPNTRRLVHSTLQQAPSTRHRVHLTLPQARHILQLHRVIRRQARVPEQDILRAVQITRRAALHIHLLAHLIHLQVLLILRLAPSIPRLARLILRAETCPQLRLGTVRHLQVE